MAFIPLTEPLGIKRAAHLLRRVTFGADKNEIEEFSLLTPQFAMERVFSKNISDPLLPIDTETGQEWVLSGRTDANSEESTLQEYFKRWLIGQALRKEDLPVDERIAYNVREKITFFMHTHFTTKISKVNSSRSLYFQNQLFRLFAFDDTVDEWRNFKDLTKKISVDNAMLKFLDGRQNVKGNPNENFARELQELYSIGRGLEGTLSSGNDPGDYTHFTEQDVQEAARVLSGFGIDDDFITIDLDTGLPRGVAKGGAVANAHDNDTKQFSHRYNFQTIAPKPELIPAGVATEESALDEIGQLIDMIFGMPETAKNICRKLYRFYTYYDINEEIDNTVIEDMAQTFVANGFRIQPVLTELFTSKYFYEGDTGTDDDHFGAIIKSPLDLVVGSLRMFDVQIPDYATETASFYEFTGWLSNEMRLQGMNVYEPFEVAGYSAYHQYPIYNRSWISTNYLANRYNFIRNIISSEMMPGSNKLSVFDFVSIYFGDIAENPRILVEQLVKYLLPMHESLSYDDSMDDDSEITAPRLNYFLFAFLYSPQLDADPEGTWTTRWNTLMEKDVMVSQLENLINSLLQSPEYQLA